MSHFEIAPCLIPLGFANGIVNYSGFINISGQSYRVDINIPSNGGLCGAQFCCEWKLLQRIQHKVELIQQRLKNADSMTSFLQEFVHIAESCVKEHSIETDIWSLQTSQILQQIEELGWENLVSIDESLSHLEFGLYDNAARWHKIQMKFNTKDPNTPAICETSLPEIFHFSWSGKTCLKHIFQEFQAAVSSYQHFWDIMQEIDDKCWVLEPEQPTFADTRRRIAIGPNLSIQINVNCGQPSTFPECRFLGTHSAISELREKLNVNLHMWDAERSLLRNLQEVLDLDFPSRTETRIEELTVDCGICYCHHQQQEIPEIVCEQCKQHFHQSCLYEWLRSLSARQNFNMLFGECPLCGHCIRVKITS